MTYTDPTPRDPQGTGHGDRWPTYAGYALLAAVALAIIVALTSRDMTSNVVKEAPPAPAAQTESSPPAATPTTPPAATPDTTTPPATTPPATNP